MKKQFLDAKDISIILGRSLNTAHRRIRKMNAELEAEGYYTETGKIPVQMFEEKYKGIKVPEELLDIY